MSSEGVIADQVLRVLSDGYMEELPPTSRQMLLATITLAMIEVLRSQRPVPIEEQNRICQSVAARYRAQNIVHRHNPRECVEHHAYLGHVRREPPKPITDA